MNITENGAFTFEPSTSTTVALVSGNLGSATIAVGYTSEDASFVPFESSESVTTGKQYYIEHGKNIDLVVQTTGADGSTNAYITFSVVTL